jgi:hypothetical protein
MKQRRVFRVKLCGYQVLTKLPLEFIKYISEILALEVNVKHQAFILKKAFMKLMSKNPPPNLTSKTHVVLLTSMM